jgi:hypothetical protein
MLRKFEIFSLPLIYMFDVALGITMIIYLKALTLILLMWRIG